MKSFYKKKEEKRRQKAENRMVNNDERALGKISTPGTCPPAKNHPYTSLQRLPVLYRVQINK